MILRACLFGCLAAAAAFALLQGAWALSPHTPWVNLLFKLFPEPALVESARLILILLLPAAAVRGKTIWLASSAGFALLAMLSALGDALTATALAFALAAGALNVMLTVIGFAMKARQAPPFLIFCVLALLHGAHNGGLIALGRGAESYTVLLVDVGLLLAYAALTFVLLRGSDALRGEDRRVG